MTLLACWSACLARLSGQDDVVIGSPIAGRNRAELEPLIGFFVNTIALRLDLSGLPTVEQLLQRTKERVLEAQQHQDLPFEQIVEIVRPLRSTAHTPLFQVMFAWQNTPAGTLTLPGLQLESTSVADLVAAKFDLTLNLQEAGNRIIGGLEYATALFNHSTVERYLGYWKNLLRAMVQDDQQVVALLEMMSDAERAQLLEGWNETEREYPKDRCLHELFEDQVAKTPDAVAVVHGSEELTYAELNGKANQLAHYLRSVGVGPDVLVGICAERSLEMMVGLLGILKAGGAYVPLDPAYPRERLAYMLEDSAPALVLTQGGGGQALDGIAETVRVDLKADAGKWTRRSKSNPERMDGMSGGQLAYVIYTSGSTGRPKGVMVEHAGVCNLILAQNRAFEVTVGSRVLQFASISFDACIFETVMALCNGAAGDGSAGWANGPGLPGGGDPAQPGSVVQFVPTLLGMVMEQAGFAACRWAQAGVLWGGSAAGGVGRAVCRSAAGGGADQPVWTD